LILRSLTKHVQDQNWFAVSLDFAIVVIGVFIGIQVANWNEERAEYRRETDALMQLRKEIEASIVATDAKAKAYQQATEAGKRSLAFLESDKACGEDCWDLIVDFMHASQWQDLNTIHASYQNMRNQGFPQSVVIVDAVEAYLAQNRNNADTFETLPVYRSLIRQMVGIEAQEFYWQHCWSLVDGVEDYNLDCPEGVSAEEASKMVETIVENSNLKPHLTEWIGAIVSLPQTLGSQNIAAQKAVELITAEIEQR
jgi:hypothetical protein